MVERKCVGCGKIKDRQELIKITKVDDDIIVNPDSKKFGRSVYVCYNNVCIENAFKKNRISKFIILKKFMEDMLLLYYMGYYFIFYFLL